ncbi:MAG: hypothetical protein J6Z01_15050 [Bacteroidales bacterium]|nr:hypothetical protein [Bacteroidales bacterium]
MSAINKEIEEYYNTLVFKDNAHTQYYYDIIARNGNIEYPLISILQNRRQATGAERFKQAMERVCDNKNVTSVIVREYNNCSDEAEPISTNEFELSRNAKKMKKKNALQKPQQGFGSLEDTNNFLSGFGQSLSMLGIQGGLGGIIQNSAMQIAQQGQLETALGTINDLKGDKRSLEDEIKQLKRDNELLKDNLKKEEYSRWDLERKKDNEIADLKRDLKQTEQRYSEKLTLGSLASTAFFGVLSKKLKIDEKLDGLLTDDDSTAEPQPTQSDLSAVNIEPVNPETADTIDEINRYLKTLDKSRIECVGAIIQYLSLGDNEMKKIYNIVSNH